MELYSCPYRRMLHPVPGRSRSESETSHWRTRSSPRQLWSLFREESAPMILTSPASREYNRSGDEADRRRTRRDFLLARSGPRVALPFDLIPVVHRKLEGLTSSDTMI